MSKQLAFLWTCFALYWAACWALLEAHAYLARRKTGKNRHAPNVRLCTLYYHKEGTSWVKGQVAPQGLALISLCRGGGNCGSLSLSIAVSLRDLDRGCQQQVRYETFGATCQVIRFVRYVLVALRTCKSSDIPYVWDTEFALECLTVFFWSFVSARRSFLSYVLALT